MLPKIIRTGIHRYEGTGVRKTEISQRDAYKLMLKDYPDVMSIEQMCEILSISTQ